MIVTLTGPSGSGKTSLLFKLMKRWPDKIHPIISSTSRSPRSREIEGISYYFVDRSAFDSEDMVEKVTFGDNLYGLTKEELSKACASPKICIAIVDAKGSLWLKEHCGAIRFYIKTAPGVSRYRLNKRDGIEEARKRHQIDISEHLYESDGYDAIIRTNSKNWTKIIKQFVIAIKPYIKGNEILKLE